MRQLVIVIVSAIYSFSTAFAADFEIQSAANDICRRVSFTPKPPFRPDHGVFPYLGIERHREDPGRIFQMRDTVVEINTSTAALPFRISAYNQSYPIQILYRSGDSFSLGPVIRPGTSMDINRGGVYARYYCAGGAGDCASIKPLAWRCRGGGTSALYWISGWASLLEHRDEYRRSVMEWRNQAKLFKKWTISERVTIVDSVETTTYLLRGDGSGRVFVDGVDTGFMLSKPRYYTGHIIEAEFPNLSSKTVYFEYKFIR